MKDRGLVLILLGLVLALVGTTLYWTIEGYPDFGLKGEVRRTPGTK